MTTTRKMYGLIAILVIVVGAIFAYAFWPHTSFGASPPGTTFNTGKVAGVSMAPLTNNATSSSILNTDANGRWVKAVDVGCTGVGTSGGATGAGVASLLVQAATTTTFNNGLQGNTNYIGNVTVATTTSFSQSASSTLASATSYSTDFYFWPSQTYLTFDFNATNTAACAISASYFAS